MSLASVCVFCEPLAPRWGNFKHLITVLGDKGVKLESVRSEGFWNGKEYTYDDVDGFSFFEDKAVSNYTVVLCFDNRREIQILRLVNLKKQEIQSIKCTGIEEKIKIDEIVDILGLSICTSQKKALNETIFIAYHFDDVGQHCADQISLFLGHLGFNVLTGRSFSPQSIKDKVTERMNRQDVVLVIHTNGSDNTWITQETILGAMKKPLIILKQKTAEFKPGILADFEYIEFENNDIQKVFIPLIEGLEELGFSFK